MLSLLISPILVSDTSTRGERTITHHVGLLQIGGWTAYVAETNGSACLLEIIMFLSPIRSPAFARTAGWSNGMRSRLQNQRSRVQIPIVSRGFYDEHLLSSHGLYYIIINITDICTIYVCLSVI
jgi:hypothetical protein